MNDEEEEPEIQWPAHVMWVAQTQCGKTNGILNTIRKEDFDNVFVVTASGSTGNLNSLVYDKKCVLNDFSSAFIKELIAYHEAVKEESNMYPKTLIVFDDFVGLSFNFKTDPMLNLLASAGRNFGISVLFSCQVLDQIPTVLRRNAHYLFLGKNSEGVIQQLVDQLATPSMGGRKHMQEQLRMLELQDGRYPFFHVDKKKRSHFVWEAKQVLV